MKLLTEQNCLSNAPSPGQRPVGPPPALDLLVEFTRKLLNAADAFILLEKEGRRAAPHVTVLGNKSRPTALIYTLGERVREMGGPLIIADARRDERLGDLRANGCQEVAACLGVPLRTEGGNMLGSFVVTDKRPRQWSPGELGILSELAQLAIADIEMQRKMGEQNETLARHEDWFESMPLASLQCDADGRITRWNRGAHHLFGFAAEQMRGRFPDDVLFQPEEQGKFRERVQRALPAERQPADWWQLTACRADGREVICEWSVTQSCRADGKPGGFITFARDVTETIAAAATQQELKNQLLHAQKLTTIGQLACVVAHDFNNVITVVLAHAGLMQMNGPLTSDLADSVAHIHKAAQCGTNLTRQLLTFGRQQPVTFEELEFSAAIGNFGKLLTHLVGDKIRLKFRLAEESLFVRADASMLDQVVMNLVVNARDAMREGGDLIVETAAVEYQGQQAPAGFTGRVVRLTVSDTGCGISPAVLPQVFKPFFTTKSASGGTGLGLSAVQDIMNQHQGWIEIESMVGRGTTVHAYLPRV